VGLGISVGTLSWLNTEDQDGATWFKENLAGINAVLREHGLPDHVEPEQISPAPKPRAELMGFPYSFVHYLRRVYAYAMAQPGWTYTAPVVVDYSLQDDAVVDDEYSLMRSHLMCHSDAEGFYVPVDFPDPLFDDGSNRILGGMLGSSYGLMRELVVIAPTIGIKLDGDKLTDDEAARINAMIDGEHALDKELVVWLALFEAARLSIEHRTAISFG
jgi:hypothetical protein